MFRHKGGFQIETKQKKRAGDNLMDSSRRQSRLAELQPVAAVPPRYFG